MYVSNKVSSKLLELILMVWTCEKTLIISYDLA